MRIYEFEVQESYEWVIPRDEADFDLFRSFDGSARAKAWTPVPMRLVTEDEQGRPLRSSDGPWLGKHAPVLRLEASLALAPILANDGELLPLECDEAALVVFNTTTVLDALDLARSTVVRFPSTGRIMKVTSHVFRAERLRGVHAFKVPELLRGSVFVTDEVVSAAQAARLGGVGFRLAWDTSAQAGD
jgi:uncharacterized protein DUF1629